MGDTPTPPNGSSSRVTTFELYQAIEALRLEVRLEARVVKQAIEGKNGINDRLDDHELRLRPVERWKNAVPVGTLLLMATTTIALIALFMKG